jgi:hypothetical protein
VRVLKQVRTGFVDEGVSVFVFCHCNHFAMALRL